VCGFVILGSIPAFSGEKARPPVTIAMSALTRLAALNATVLGPEPTVDA
jgi:hypothetical protein